MGIIARKAGTQVEVGGWVVGGGGPGGRICMTGKDN